jgi:hypothetical protein
VDTPRPLGALVMVGAASASLAATGQLAPWAVAAQVASLGAAFLLRERPQAWQRSPALLNGGLLAIAAVTLVLWLRGHAFIIALAHFATFTQGLQLLDARPRKSEFLLVALALFQLILASNLTDSVFFPALLVVFLLATVWTLLIHTLHAEALEAGDPLAASRVTTPGLLRTTLVASTLSVLLALAMFVVLPRMHSAVIRGGSLAPRMATSGFSDQVELGELGRIRSDTRPVLHVETLSGDEPASGAGYWRGLAFDRFDGRRWSVQPARRRRLPGLVEWGIDVEIGGPAPDLVQRIAREPVASGVLFSAGRARKLSGPLAHVERDTNGGLYVSAQADERVSYTVSSHSAVPTRTALVADRAAPPPRDPERYLQLPPLSPWVGELAVRIVEGAASDAERAARLEAHLRQNGRYSHTPPVIDPNDPRSPVEVFLERGSEGHCEYFASAMVLLGRSLGLPMRLVNGFAGGRPNRIGGFVTLSRADAHAWVELHFEGAGWVRYDPTPPDLRLIAGAGGPLSGLREFASAIELWWFQRVVEFDRSTQGRALRSAWLAWRRWREPGSHAPAEATARNEDPGRFVDGRVVVATALLLATFLALARLRGGRRRSPVPDWYAAALRLLARRDLVRAPSLPARTFARQVAEALPGPAAVAFAALTEAYLAERFGGRVAEDGPDALRSLRDSLGA